MDEDEEVANEEKFDEFAHCFARGYEPKVLMTTNIRPSKKTFDFLKEVQTALPNCFYWERKDYTLKEVCD